MFYMKQLYFSSQYFCEFCTSLTLFIHLVILNFFSSFVYMSYACGGGGTRWHSGLRHCATNRKVAGSIPDGVTGVFHWQSFQLRYDPGVDSACNRNYYQEYFLGVKAAGARTDDLTTFMCQLSWNLWAPTSWNPQGMSSPVMGLLYLFMCVCTYVRVLCYVSSYVYMLYILSECMYVCM
jgi:hypothetical protein